MTTSYTVQYTFSAIGCLLDLKQSPQERC